MGVEIERKFLVVGDAWKEHVISEAVIRQGYLASSPELTIRVRLADGRAWLNIKGATVGISRREYEYEIPPGDAEEMLDSLTRGAVIDKIRYQVKCGGHVWDLDLFRGENLGLILAEVELAEEHEAFERPEWAGREVSTDARYYNANLARYPYGNW